ncbi:MAG: histidinol-phosphate transaminase [Bacteroidia bacterium]
MMFDLNNIIRENIKKLRPYSSARDEYKGKEGIFLDANENSHKKLLYNRYPDPLQIDLKKKISEFKKIAPENVFIGNGSDEAIDILFRAFCEPAKDNIIICPPTYGMYEVSANINNVEVLKIPLSIETFQLETENILKAITTNTKLIFICCPNNPTGNGVQWNDIKLILEKFNGLVVIDEAYIDFASYRSLIPELSNYPNLVILQTLSKAWGMAGLRIGMAFASKETISVFNKIKPPYNVNVSSQKLALEILNNVETLKEQVNEIISERNKLSASFSELTFILKIYPSEANFILIKVINALDIYNYLIRNKIIIRNRSTVTLCEECLRITIGTKEENKILLNVLKNYK